MTGLGLGLGLAYSKTTLNAITSAYKTRVEADSGTVEALGCVNSEINRLNSIGILGSVGLAMIASGYKATKLYSVIPNNGNGDFTAARTSIANRDNPSLQLENMAANVPRVNYPGCPSLLLEPARTNLITYPVSFDNAYWTKSGASIDDNSGAGYSSPSVDYPTNAFKMVESLGGTTHILRRLAWSFTSGSTYTYTIFAKAGERNWLLLSTANLTTWNAAAYFDLENGVVGTVVGGAAKIEDLSNGWYKCSIVGLSGATANTAVDTYTSESDGGFSYSGDGLSGLFVFGAQMEAADYPTSFIYDGTEGSTTTRTEDRCYDAGTSAEFNASEGVLYFKGLSFLVASGAGVVSINDGTSNNVVQFYYTTDSTIVTIFMKINGTTIFPSAGSAINIGDITDETQIAIRYKSGDNSVVIDGVEKLSNAVAFSTGALDRLSFEQFDTANRFFGESKIIATFKTGLTDAQMIALTS